MAFTRSFSNAKEAGVYVLFATVDPAAGYKGITAFIVESNFPGFTVGKKEDKLGIRASSTCELRSRPRKPRIGLSGRARARTRGPTPRHAPTSAR